MDSDRAGQNAAIGEAKRRLQDEFDGGPGFAWVTAGREVENYINPQVLEEVVKATHSNAIRLPKTGRYDRAYAYVLEDGTVRDRIDKVKVARQVASRPADLETLDLDQRMEDVVRFIYESNDTDEFADEQAPACTEQDDSEEGG